MSGRNFSLTDRLSAFIDQQVEAGTHQNASEVVREALRRYEQDLLLESAIIDQVAARGITDIERGDFSLVSGPEGAAALLERLNLRAGNLPGRKLD